MYPVFIYTLNCPTTGIVRYLGQTTNPDARLKDHLRNAGLPRKEKWHVYRWIKNLITKNLRPGMEILDVVPDIEADFWEREYIQNFRERGFDLTNITPGGDGVGIGQNHPLFGKTGEQSPWFGRKHRLESRIKQRNAKIGTKLSLAHRTKISNAMKGRKRTPEHCANLSNALKGNKNGKRKFN